MVSDLYERALRLAAVGHRDQQRRGSGIPYVAHPYAVARIVERAGYDEPVAIAALLHDLVEDTATPLAAIRHQFGDLVADTVAACSEQKLDAAGQLRPWDERKRDHLSALGRASESTRAVVLADKLHNLQSIRLDLEAGLPVWNLFHAGREQVLGYFSAMILRCESQDDRIRVLTAACREELERVEQFSGKNSDFVELEG